jgi:hypothetical protein
MFGQSRPCVLPLGRRMIAASVPRSFFVPSFVVFAHAFL